MIYNNSLIQSEHSICLTCVQNQKNSFLDLVRKSLIYYGLKDKKPELIQNFSFSNKTKKVFFDISKLTSDKFNLTKDFLSIVIGRKLDIIISGFSWNEKTHIELISEIFYKDELSLEHQKSSNGFYFVHNLKNDYVNVLSGVEIPQEWKGRLDSSYFIIKNNDFKPIISGYDSDGKMCPYLIEYDKGGHSIFLLCKTDFYIRKEHNPSYLSPLALSVLLLIRIFAGSLCWHNNNYFANLTIDDPNLIEPYGYLSYRYLLKTMNKFNFHTTIAFIPWNYNRTKKKVEDIFLENSDRFSLAIHGNDHDGYEFHSKKSLKKQKCNMSEAILRMEWLKKKTGLDYTKVMIFPHKIGSREAVKLLNYYGYLASMNRQIIPKEWPKSNKFSFGIRPSQNYIDNFPLCERWHPEDIIPELEAFFGKPILIYSHLFNSFDQLRKVLRSVIKINKLEPKWSNLGDVVKNLFLKKQENINYEHVWMFSRTAEFINEDLWPKKVRFYRREINNEKFRVFCNGKQIPFDIDSGYINFEVDSYPKKRINIIIEKGFQKLSSCHYDLNLRIFLRRYICDFRDRFWRRLNIF